MELSNLPSDKGICNSCEDKGDCPMPTLLEQHRNNIAEYGEDYDSVRPDLWDEYSIDEPEVENDEVIWCPMHFSG
jgi:hypothetical protein